MIRLATLLLLIVLTGCAHQLVNCPNARAAALVATQAVARICPFTLEN